MAGDLFYIDIMRKPLVSFTLLTERNTRTEPARARRAVCPNNETEPTAALTGGAPVCWRKNEHS